jgi:hypothetical protein
MDERELIATLEQAKAHFRVMRHKPVFNIPQACEALHVLPSQVAKNLLLSDDFGVFMLLVRGDTRADFDALAKKRGTKRVMLATPDDVYKKTGVKIGSVNLFSWPDVFIDESVTRLPEINVHPDDNAVTVFVKTDDILRLVPKAVIGKFSK